MFRLLKDKAISLKLKSKLILSFMLTSVFILLLFALFFYRYTSTTLLQQSEKATLSSLSQLEVNLTTVLNTVNTVSRNILVSSYFSEEMKLDQISSPDDVQFINDVYDYFSEMMTSYDYIHSIVYYGDNGLIIGSSDNKNYFNFDSSLTGSFYETQLKKDLEEKGGPIVCGGLRYSDFFGGTYSSKMDTRYITLGRRLQTAGQTSGYVVINIRESYLRSLYHDDKKNVSGESLLLDAHDLVISAENKELIGTKAVTSPLDTDNTVHLTLSLGDNDLLNKNNQIIYYPYEHYGLSIVYEMPFEILFENIHQLKVMIITLLAVFLVLALIISMFWIYAITKPLNSLIAAMKTMGSGQIGVRMEAAKSSDFKFLTDQFNQMSRNIQHLIDENEIKQEERHELAVQNLQNQLSPHFLYNTLNTIKWMAIVSKATNVADCVTALGNLLQPLFRNTKTTWPLSDELNYLKNYLRIMNYRTGTPIDFTSEIDPSILPCLMPKFILQPLLENAISHQNPSPEVKNTITLTGHREDNTIFLVLTDNGLGIDPDRLQVLQELLASNEDCTKPLDRASLPQGIGIGILNTNRRIKLQYGNACGLTVASAPGRGTSVTLTLVNVTERV